MTVPLFKVEAQKPHVSEVMPQYFTAGFLLVFSIVFLLVDAISTIPILFGALIVYMFSLMRTKADSERIEIIDNVVYVFRKNIRRWHKPIEEIEMLDINTFDEHIAMRGQTMMVFYLKTGESWSTTYVNYSQKQLKDLKHYIESRN